MLSLRSMQGLARRIPFWMAQLESQMDDVVLSTLDRDDGSSIPSNSAANVPAKASDKWYEVSAAATGSKDFRDFQPHPCLTR
jgi:hypothetical protein